MKNLFYLITVCFFTSSSTQLFAQAEGCGTGRYMDNSFVATSDVLKTTGITFGSNKAVGGGGNQTLRLDFYEPANDTGSKRPLVIFAFGGSFVGGDRNQVAPFCQAFTEMGYVCAAIDYRIGFFIPNEVNTTLAVVRGMHDMKAAVRFFRKEAALYKIDTDRIIIGGVSAGAISAVQAAYLDSDSEIPSYLYGDTTGFGGVEGNSGNGGFSSKVAGVINYSGAIGDTNWVQIDDVPLIGFHDDGDNTVPYDTREVSVGGIPTGLVASGSGDLHKRLVNIGVVDTLITINSNGHVSYVNNANDLRNTLDITKEFLYEKVTCKQDVANSIANKNLKNPEVNLYPNPTNGQLYIESLVESNKPYNVSIYDFTGKLIFQTTYENTLLNKIELKEANGIYRVNIKYNDTQYAIFSKNVVLQ